LVIEAASAGVKDMADGSLRITFEFEPRHAAEAFALFGPRGRAVAVAALKDGSAAVKEPEPEKPKGGEWAKLAGIWCADPDFCTWLQQNHKMGPIQTAEDASKAMRQLCGITSRVELDHDELALRRFNQTIRHPFMKWMQARGIQK
jgi:hypothetical protein